MATFHATDYGHLMKASPKHRPNVLGQNRQTAGAKLWIIFASTLSTHFVIVRPKSVSHCIAQNLYLPKSHFKLLGDNSLESD